jgi:hypothetical protein
LKQALDLARGHMVMGYGLLATVGAVLGLCLLWWGLHGNTIDSRTAVFVIVVILVALACIWFVLVFTGPTTAQSVERMVRYCYVATVVLASAFLVFFFPSPATAWPEFYGPIGVVRGCSESPTPREILPRSLAAAPATSSAAAKPTDGPASANGRSSAASAGDGGSERDWTAVRLPSSSSIPREIECGNNSPQWLLNVGGQAIPGPASYDPQVNRPQQHRQEDLESQVTHIRGGLVVPVYFIVLSFFGAIVSMTRRVPEYQGRIGPNASKGLTYEEAREELVFQLMQVLSAPLIAVTAYYLVDPNTRTASIALGFICGFSSETVLLYIRAATEKLQPQVADKSALIVSPAQLDFDATVVGESSTEQKIVLSNRSPKAVKIGNVMFTEGFVCGDPSLRMAEWGFVAPGTARELSIVFKPIRAGKYEGSVTISDDGVGSPRSITLKGTGIAPVEQKDAPPRAPPATPPAPAPGASS